MEIEKTQEAQDIKTILSSTCNYIIPIYQRNYAWGRKEIVQLIKDIVEFFEIRDIQNYKKDKAYYLGSLVCSKKENAKGTVYELIDGQQRYTTLILIHLVLKNWGEPEIESSISKLGLNLRFASRKNTQSYLESLFVSFKNLDASNIEGIGNIKSAIDFIQDELRNLSGKDNEIINIDLFAKYFYNNVKLFHVEVPRETDLNHYFEIMNTRGEQLEKHEIVKARLMGKIARESQNKFAAIWDACSDMNSYVYSEFESLFDNNGNFDSDEILFAKIPLSGNDDGEEKSLNYILSNHSISNNSQNKETPEREKYRSIINFPNFLLQILKLKHQDMKISLDDKKLLKQFEKYLATPNFSSDDSEDFIADLLKYRLLFDKYIIKQDLSYADENKQNWGIRKPNITCKEKVKKVDGTVKTFEKDEDDELVKLQVMLYYSDSTNTYNDWLHDILVFLNELKTEQYSFSENTEKVKNFTSKVFDIAKGKFDKNHLSYPKVTIFNLYFIDFLLWKLYIDEIRGKNDESDLQAPLLGLKQKIFKKRSLFSTFKFKDVNSKEHLFPRTKADIENEDEINSIGNLCLISSSQNSQGNNNIASEKRKKFKDDNSSLKRLIMFESFDGDKWEKEQIEKHSEEIKNLLEVMAGIIVAQSDKESE